MIRERLEMDNNIKIGVIIPIYKIPYNYLKECFNSLKNQTYTNIEIILIDDASPDKCGRWCDEFAAKDNRVTVIHNKKNQGVSMARNIGLDNLKCDYVTFIDGDDWIDKDVIENIVSWILSQKKKAEMVMYRQVIEYPHFKKMDDIFKTQFWVTKKELEKLQFSVISSAIKGTKESAIPMDNIAGKFILKELLDEHCIRFKSIPYREDGVFFQEVVEKSTIVAAIPYGFYHYRYRKGSAVNQYRPEAPQEQLMLCKYMWKYAKENQKDKEYFHGLYSFLLIPIQMVISTYYYHPYNKMNIFKKHKECKKYLSQKPYCDIFKNIKIRELKRNPQIKMILLKLHLYWGLYKLREIYNNRIIKG